LICTDWLADGQKTRFLDDPDILIKYGATPIDYHTQDWVEVICQAEPDGLDAVFEGMILDFSGSTKDYQRCKELKWALLN